MSQDEVVTLLNVTYLVIIGLGFFLAAARLWARWVEYREAKWPRPYLLVRETALLSGCAWLILVVLMARVFSWDIRDELWWPIISGTPAVVGIWYYVYVEYLKLGPAKKKLPPTRVRKK